MEKRITYYTRRADAIRGMWRYYNRYIRGQFGSPDVNYDGTKLLWVDNGTIKSLTVMHVDHKLNSLIKSWVGESV